VTKKICEELDLKLKGILLGSELDTLTDDALKIRVEKTTIFARFSPDEKNRVINALRSNGHTVGYMGDGINDAPSIKAADVGISVNNAVDVAKESADIILTHKSLAVLVDGVIEGRKTFGNMIKYLLMVISSNFGNMFSYTGAVLFLPFPPMLPLQIVLNNLIYDVSQITIPTDNVDEEYIKKPKKWDINAMKKYMIVFGPVSSFFDFATFAMLLFIFQAPAGVFQTAWFMESIATQSLVIHVLRTRKIPFIESWPSLPLIIGTIACVSIAWIIPFTPLNEIFKFSPLPAGMMLGIAAIVALYLATVMIVKYLFYRSEEEY